LLILDGFEDATDEEFETIFLILEFTEDVTVEALMFLAGEGVGVIAVPGGIFVARRSAMAAGILVSDGGTAFRRGRFGHDGILSY
jgi:hypothetical protein